MGNIAEGTEVGKELFDVSNVYYNGTYTTALYWRSTPKNLVLAVKAK